MSWKRDQVYGALVRAGVGEHTAAWIDLYLSAAPSQEIGPKVAQGHLRDIHKAKGIPVAMWVEFRPM